MIQIHINELVEILRLGYIEYKIKVPLIGDTSLRRIKKKNSGISYEIPTNFRKYLES